MTWVSSDDKFSRNGPTKWRRCGGKLCRPLFHDWAHRCDCKKHSFLPLRFREVVVSVLTHGPYEISRHFPGSKQFNRDPRLSLETPGWEVMDYEGNTLSPADLERHCDHIMRAALALRDREYPFPEDVIVDESVAVDPNLWWRKSFIWLRFCGLEGDTSWCISSARTSFCLLGGWT